jgi:CelD/BcsL family acetyltransferase involved in cellulose biosynthesis
MRVTCLSDLSQLAPLTAAWRELAAGVPFRTPEWLLPWWENYGAGRELRVLAVFDEQQQLRGLAPWCVEASASSGRTLSFLGGGEVCSDYHGLVTTDEYSDAVIAGIADWLVAEQGSEWDLLHLTGVTAGEPTITKLAQRLTDEGLTVHQRPGLNTWRIEFDCDWEAYVESLSKSHRKQVRRIVRRIVETGEAQLHVVRSPEELPAALDLLVALHQKRRISLDEPGCFADPRFEGFIRSAAPQLLAQGLLRLCWAELAGKPISVEFQLAGGGVTYAYQAGLDPDALDEEPGRIINIATLKHALQEGQRAFDFLRGDEPYKAHWRAVPYASLDLRVVPRKTSAQLRHNLWLAGDTVKQWLKAGLGRTEGASHAQ